MATSGDCHRRFKYNFSVCLCLPEGAFIMETISILFFTPFMLLYLTRNPPSELFLKWFPSFLTKVIMISTITGWLLCLVIFHKMYSIMTGSFQVSESLFVSLSIWHHHIFLVSCLSIPQNFLEWNAITAHRFSAVVCDCSISKFLFDFY